MAARRVVAYVFLIALLAGCAGSRGRAAYPSAKTAIPNLARHPYRLYAIDAETGEVLRFRLDGTHLERVVGDLRPRAASSFPLKLGATGTLFSDSSRPSAEAKLENAFEGRGTVQLQAAHPAQNQMTLRPIWEELAPDPKPAPPPLRPGQSKVFRTRDPFTFESPWGIRYFSKVSRVGDREISHVAEIRLRHRDGRARARRFTADPAAMVSVLGIFESRYLLVFDNPDVLLWDLERNTTHRIVRALDARLVWYDPALNAQPPRAQARIGRDDFAWNLQNPDDLAIQPQHLVRKPVQ